MAVVMRQMTIILLATLLTGCLTGAEQPPGGFPNGEPGPGQLPPSATDSEAPGAAGGTATRHAEGQQPGELPPEGTASAKEPSRDPAEGGAAASRPDASPSPANGDDLSGTPGDEARPRRIGPLQLPAPTSVREWPALTVRPLLSPSESTALNPLQEALQQFTAGGEDLVGVHVYDLATGQSAAVEDRTPFLAASTFKVPICLYILDLAGQGRASLAEEVPFQEDDWENGTGVLWYIQEGDTLPVHRLLELAIVYSDNIAANMLINRFSRRAVWNYMQAQGAEHIFIPEPVTDPDKQPFLWNVTSPRDMNLLLAQLAGQDTLEPDHRDMLLSWMGAAVYRDRLPRLLPEDVPVANKIGTLPEAATLPGSVADVGLVFLPDRAYAVSVYVRSSNVREASEKIARISRLIYDHMAALPVLTGQ